MQIEGAYQGKIFFPRFFLRALWIVDAPASWLGRFSGEPHLPRLFLPLQTRLCALVLAGKVREACPFAASRSGLRASLLPPHQFCGRLCAA
jgi:hypothetical protein